jgi:hypothetical protein
VAAAEPAEAGAAGIGRPRHTTRRTDPRALRDPRWTLDTRHARRRGRIRSVHARHTRCARSLHARHARCLRSLHARHVPWRVGGIRA